ncbi:Acyl-coenzyme A thioesterase 13, partial [Dispira simplex]
MSVPHLRTVFQRFLDYKGYDAAILSNLKVVSATPGSVKCTVPVQKENTNRLGSAHGGWLATIVDIA